MFSEPNTPTNYHDILNQKNFRIPFTTLRKI